MDLLSAGYVTFAETPPDAKDYPGALPHMLKAGSLVFTPPKLPSIGPRNMVHSWATDTDDPTVQPRWGKIGKQRIEDAGPLYQKRVQTVDDEILKFAVDFIDNARRNNKPFFVWLNPTRMHVVTHLSEKYEKMRTPENGRSKRPGWRNSMTLSAQSCRSCVTSMSRTIGSRFLDRQRRREFHLADGGQTPFAGGKGTALEGGFRVPCIIRWPGHVPAGKVENGIISGLDWLPTFVSAAGNPNIAEELKKGKQLGDTTYKVHLDGYDQTDLITGKGPSARHEVLYFTEGTLSAVRIDDFKYRFTDQPSGWLGATVKVDWPILTNLRLDPFERTGMPSGDKGSLAFYNWFAYEFWRFVNVQREVARLAQTAIEFPPMQRGASFNLDAVKAKIEAAMKAHSGE